MEHPLAMDAEAMRHAGYATVDALVARLADPKADPVLRRADAAVMRARLGDPPPEQPGDYGAVLARVMTDVLPYAARTDHPGYLAFIPSFTTWPAALAELTAAAANLYCGAWMESAGATQIELEVIDWFRGWLGLPAGTAGLLVNGGSAGNLTALLVAREAAGGPSPDSVLYVSDQAHSSLARTARAMGLRPHQVRVLPTDDRAGIVAGSGQDVLRAVPLLSGVPASARHAVHARGVWLDVATGEEVIRRWDADRFFYIVLAGRYDVFIDARLIRTHGPGDHFGELAARDWGGGYGYARLATIRCAEPGRLLRLTSQDLQCEVAGLVTTPARDRVTGARVRPRADGGAEETLAADLVVDATGRGGRTAQWLTEIGYDPPAEEQLRVDIKYASRHLRLRAGALGDEKLILIGTQPGRPAAMALFAQEGDRWILTLAGYAGHHPPTDEAGFLAFARSVARRTSSPPSATRNRSTGSAPTVSRPVCGGGTSGCAGSPPGCWSSGTRSAASTRSTGRACPWPRWKRSPCGTAWPVARPIWPAGSSGPPPSRSTSPGS
jgi:hypothetical protein